MRGREGGEGGREKEGEGGRGGGVEREGERESGKKQETYSSYLNKQFYSDSFLLCLNK